ncbi:hypothetical protein ENBRE01_2882 [Enteropsectra breve]|nr:hypothetical protein ENBRE01_2882 [Enteropsectra breve]
MKLLACAAVLGAARAYVEIGMDFHEGIKSRRLLEQMKAIQAGKKEFYKKYGSNMNSFISTPGDVYDALYGFDDKDSFLEGRMYIYRYSRMLINNLKISCSNRDYGLSKERKNKTMVEAMISLICNLLTYEPQREWLDYSAEKKDTYLNSLIKLQNIIIKMRKRKLKGGTLANTDISTFKNHNEILNKNFIESYRLLLERTFKEYLVDFKIEKNEIFNSLNIRSCMKKMKERSTIGEDVLYTIREE